MNRCRLRDRFERSPTRVVAMTGQPKAKTTTTNATPPPSASPVFTVDEIAEHCGVTLADVHAWIHTGMIKVATVGRRCKVTTDEFRSFVERMDIPIDESIFDRRH